MLFMIELIYELEQRIFKKPDFTITVLYNPLQICSPYPIRNLLPFYHDDDGYPNSPSHYGQLSKSKVHE